MKIQSRLKKGYWVRIYQDPITKKDFEGQAKLVANNKLYNGNLENWEVEFPSDKGMTFTRWVDPSEILVPYNPTNNPGIIK